jgi:hypothetical protein
MPARRSKTPSRTSREWPRHHSPGWRADPFSAAEGLSDTARGYTAPTTAPPSAAKQREHRMIVLGIILLLIGYFTGISILYTIGGILVVIGVVLWILGAVGRPVGGRKVWF